MAADAKVLIGQCEACLQCRPNEQKGPLLQHDFPLRLWSKVSMDICQFDNRMLLIVSDYNSNYI